ncbi:hypothetical protein J2X36_000723 [Methylobacterium sp. BE186]|uniref:hypothetical protein n=1 Tax=Methylobacterium sp. BE186 TaxID=2817715 RepID=UPI0028671B61|nr:hypothetical protein [Methylobacterium sp. BE186]MDR7035987.1 hypothetical protein [Methylobacterium sp. BE186]
MISSTEATQTQIEPNPGFERHWSRAQSVLQSLIALVVVAGLAGLFGQGWLSRMTRTFPTQPLTVTYERLLRANAPAEMKVSATQPLPGDMLRVEIGADLLDHVSINATQPRAASVDATPDGVTYTFRLGPERQGSVLFKLAPSRVGRVDGSISAQGERLSLPLFIYP